jgi:hypothetical protein
MPVVDEPPKRDKAEPTPIPEAYQAYKDLFTTYERLPLPEYHTIEYRIDLTPGSELP